MGKPGLMTFEIWRDFDSCRFLDLETVTARCLGFFFQAFQGKHLVWYLVQPVASSLCLRFVQMPEINQCFPILLSKMLQHPLNSLDPW